MKNILILVFIFMIYSCGQNESETAASNETVNSNTEKVDNTSVIPVEAYIVKNGIIEEKIPFTGVLKPIHSVDIVSEASGKVKQINKELGNSINKNEVLAIIDDVVAKSNFEQAKAQVLTAENNLKIAVLNLKSDKQLFENGDISQLAYENSELAVKTAEANHLAAIANLSFMEKQFKDTRILSPINGIIARKFIDLGTMVNPTMPVYRVVDLSYLKLEIGVPQSIVSNIEVGNEAEITISALKNKILTGYVKYISPQADENSGAFITEIHVKNTSDQLIRAGMTAKVNLILKTKDNQLIIPNHALITKNGDRYTYKIVNETAKLIPVIPGASYGSQLVIDKGLVEGDTIVVVGMKNLGMETKIWVETLHNQ